MKGIPPGQCDLCGAEISEVRHVGSWTGPDGGGFMFVGRCLTCDVDFQLNVPDRRSSGWRRDAPEPEMLRAEVGADELVKLSAKFARYAILGPKWSAFLARRRAGDVLWRFASADGKYNGFAMVRGSQAVSSFVVFGPM